MKLKKNDLTIAIDSPVGAGKSFVANKLSQKIGITYIYTGAMYRAVAYAATKAQIQLSDEAAVVALLKRTEIQLGPAKKSDQVCTVFINNREVTEALFTPEMSEGASIVATYPQVREELVKRQQAIASHQAVVMEGRDITTRVLPHADLKIFMTADLEIRAKRRLLDLEKKGYQKSLEEVMAETAARDHQDSHRETDPLTITQDAWVLDTTSLTMDEVIDAIITKLRGKELI